MSATPEASGPAEGAPIVQDANTTVARNTTFLVVAQVIGMPLSLLVNGIMGRRLGAAEFGDIYLAGTLVSFGFLAVDWGQAATLPSMIARDRSRAGVLLGSGLVWRACSAVAVYGIIAVAGMLLGYSTRLQIALALVSVSRLFGTATAAYLDSARGFENSSLTAASQVRYNVLCAVLFIPVVLLGGRMLSVLSVLIIAEIVNAIFVVRGSRSLGIGKLRFSRTELKSQLSMGVTFMMLGLALALQPIVDAL
ncbi:MAG: oligosaccharide flippase family protein, partial [Polyangiaceae bacterium]